MRMRRKCIGPSIAVASGILLSACAASPEATREPAHPPMVIDNYRTPSPEALYAERYRTSAAQVVVDETARFVRCGEDCPGATPKTPVARVQTAVARALKGRRHAAPATIGRQLATVPTIEQADLDEASQPAAAAPPGEHSQQPDKALSGQGEAAEEASPQ